MFVKDIWLGNLALTGLQLLVGVIVAVFFGATIQNSFFIGVAFAALFFAAWFVIAPLEGIDVEDWFAAAMVQGAFQLMTIIVMVLLVIIVPVVMNDAVLAVVALVGSVLSSTRFAFASYGVDEPWWKGFVASLPLVGSVLGVFFRAWHTSPAEV